MSDHHVPQKKWRAMLIRSQSASLGRFVPHHASAVWRKAKLDRTIFRFNLEKKKLAAPIISMITSSAIDGCKLLTSEVVILSKRFWN